MGHKTSEKRLENDLLRGRPVIFYVDDQPIKAYEGETIAAALIADGRWTCQIRDARPSGVFCNIGVCHGCLMTVNGEYGVRTCQTPISEGCRVETRHIEQRQRKK
jgi:sarcosine oxidase subunit alpha